MFIKLEKIAFDTCTKHLCRVSDGFVKQLDTFNKMFITDLRIRVRLKRNSTQLIFHMLITID